MTHKSKGSIFLGLFLILFGAALLLDTFKVWDFHWSYILIVLGIFFFVTAFTAQDKGGVFPGTISFLFGLFFLLRQYDILDDPMFVLWPIFPAIVGIAFIVLFIFRPNDWGLLIPGGILIALSIIFLGYYYDLFGLDPGEIISHYWPVILVIIGLKLVLEGRGKKDKS
jgi:hypothetical protein